MRFYLSSFRVGDHGEKLVELSDGGRLAYIPNALDHIPAQEQKEAIKRNANELRELGVAAEVFDLRDFISSPFKLKDELTQFSGVWVSGGNTFVLRQAMRLADFDDALFSRGSSALPDSFLYAGYSAGVCVLAPSLHALQIVDDPNQFPYPENAEIIWEGLNVLDYIILPHYKSEHPESADIDKEVEYCEANKISYKPLRDGEVLFGEDIEVIRREK